eukprot:m.835286 g.835286  ORF g.835286 m.835286 type:complete len:528 (+) comp23454_c0_seq5:270-1853(+)
MPSFGSLELLLDLARDDFTQPSRPETKAASTPSDDDISDEHELFKAIHNNDLAALRNLVSQSGVATTRTVRAQATAGSRLLARARLFSPWTEPKQVQSQDSVNLFNLVASEACRNDPPLHRAARCGWVDMVEYLVNDVGLPVDSCKADGATPLFLAAQEGHSRVVESLVKANASLDATDEDGVSSLYIACFQGHTHIVQQLLNAGANPNQLSGDETSPVFIAAQEGYDDIVQILARANANLNTGDCEGSTPLLMASQEGHIAVVATLLAYGADPNGASMGGVRPMHSAVQSRQLALAQLLQAHGADPKAKTAHGTTPLLLARSLELEDFDHWLVASEEWDQLRVCAEARLPWVAASLFRSGKGAVLLQEGWRKGIELQESTMKPVWAPVCRTTLSVFRGAIMPWEPKSHALFGPGFRRMVLLLLLIRQRLEQSDARTTSCTSTEIAVSASVPSVHIAEDTPVVLPSLPVEMWEVLISHLHRSVQLHPRALALALKKVPSESAIDQTTPQRGTVPMAVADGRRRKLYA